MAPAADGIGRQPRQPLSGTPVADPDQADRCHDLRGLRPEKIHRRKKLFAGRLRDLDPAARPADRTSLRPRRQRHRDRHGAPRPPSASLQMSSAKTPRKSFASSPIWITCITKGGGTSNTISATAEIGRVPKAKTSGFHCVSIRATSNTSIPSPSAACGPGRTAKATPSETMVSASCFTGTPRLLEKGSCRKHST